MKYILIAVFIILFASTVLYGIFYYKERNTLDRFKIKYTIENNRLTALNEDLKGSFLNSQIYNDIEIIIPEVDRLSDFTFCLFISENQCSACVNAMLEYFTSNIDIVSDSNFIILANYNQNSIKLLRAKHQLKCKIISVFGKNTNIADNKYPCFFIYNKKRSETEMLLFPLKNEPEMIKKYFRNVNDKYFNKNSKEPKLKRR
jgi:hypothetical protein